MAFTKLSAAQLSSGAPATPASAYARFLAGLEAGEGGRATTKAEGVSRQTIKNRLTAAAAEVGATIKFHRCPENEVIFEVTSPAQVKPAGRHRRRAAGTAPQAAG